MKLTIGMIVKNEEKWLDKCLSAIKPILDNVDSELIITDTGSSDRTVEIAKQYTDKVLHFDWIKDFAAARNFGLKKAKGEWFMMLDADDIFRSCDHIIEFFNSGEYRKFNAASYISRNLFKADNGDSYSDILAPRMVKLHPHTCYEGAVHESLNTFEPPFKNLRDIADHYGYYYETEEDKYNKFRRNSELLLNRLETEKDSSPMLYIQLYEAFLGVKENEKALGYLDSGIELSKKMNSIVLATLYFHKASYFQTEKRFEDAINVCNEYFKMNKIIRPYPLTTDGEIYALKAMSLYSLEKYFEAIEEFKKFFDTYKDIESGKLCTYDSYLISAYLCNDINIMPLFINFIDCCLRTGKINTADSWLCTYPIYKYSFELKKVSELIGKELEVAEKNSYINLAKYYSRLDETGKRILADELLDTAENGDKREFIFSAFDKIAKNDPRLQERSALYKNYYSGIDVSEQITEMLRTYGIAQNPDLICMSLERNYDISTVLSVPEQELRQAAFLCCRNIEGFYEAAENYDISAILDTGSLYKAVKFYEYIISMRLMDNEDKSEEEKQQLIGKLFRVKSELAELYKRNNSAQSEFELLAKTVKNNIRAFIAKGNLSAAKKALEDYKKINPKDTEIVLLENEIV